MGLTIMLIVANKSLSKYMAVDKADTYYFYARVVLMAATIGLSIYASKYIRVVYIGFTGNVTPIITASLSVVILGEKLKSSVKLIGFLACIGGVFISYGIYLKY